MKITLIAIPIRIPISKGKARQAKKVANPGNKSDFFDLHIGLTTRTINQQLNININLYKNIVKVPSTIKITAEIIIPAKAAFGI